MCFQQKYFSCDNICLRRIQIQPNDEKRYLKSFHFVRTKFIWMAYCINKWQYAFKRGMCSSPYKQQGHISIYSVCFAVCQKFDVLLQTLVVSYVKRNFLNIFYWEKVIYVTFVFVCETHVILGLWVIIYLFVTEKK